MFTGAFNKPVSVSYIIVIESTAFNVFAGDSVTTGFAVTRCAVFVERHAVNISPIIKVDKILRFISIYFRYDQNRLRRV
jgi:hypothetical protein